jgi:peptidyl-dipeptidase A
MDVTKFLNNLSLQFEQKNNIANIASWLLETTGTKDTATLKSALEIDLKMLFNDHNIYEKLKTFEKDTSIIDPYLKRRIQIFIKSFMPNLGSKELLREITEQEAKIALKYSTFRPSLDGKKLSENDLKDILKNEKDITSRKKAWVSSKQIGALLAPDILKLVQLRNKNAKDLGYKNYFSMQLEIQEVDENWLDPFLKEIAEKSDEAFNMTMDEIYDFLSDRFKMNRDTLGPWAFSEPFFQEDPLDVSELDHLINGIDLLDAAKKLYFKMGFDVTSIIDASDNFERLNKNQHAFCINIDRKKDVRTLNNIKPTLKWLEILFHELGHAVYELGFDSGMAYELREPPHMITTEAMALFAGRQAYTPSSLDLILGKGNDSLKNKAFQSLKRRQLIFSRWVMVMTYFEKALYENPEADLNQIWWCLVEKYQKVKAPEIQTGFEWAAKYHIGLAPVYYYSYLLGEVFASTIEEQISNISIDNYSHFLNKKIFNIGALKPWHELIESCSGEKINYQAWLNQFAGKKI